MANANILKRLNEIESAVKRRRDADIYVSKGDLPAWFVREDAAWRKRTKGMPYGELIHILHEAPERPLKPEYRHLLDDLDGQARLYQLQLGAIS